MRVVLNTTTKSTVRAYRAFLTGGLDGDKMGDQKSPPPKTAKNTATHGEGC